MANLVALKSFVASCRYPIQFSGYESISFTLDYNTIEPKFYIIINYTERLILVNLNKTAITYQYRN